MRGGGAPRLAWMAQWGIFTLRGKGEFWNFGNAGWRKHGAGSSSLLFVFVVGPMAQVMDGDIRHMSCANTQIHFFSKKKN